MWLLLYHYTPAQRRWWCCCCCYTPGTTKMLGGILVHSVRPSVRPSICPSCIPCLLCSTYSSGWIHFIFIHLIKQCQKVCCVESFLQKFLQNLNFWQFFKIFNFVLFWLGIWCESLVWVNIGGGGGGGGGGESQNLCILAVLVVFVVIVAVGSGGGGGGTVFTLFHLKCTYSIHQYFLFIFVECLLKFNP